MLGQDARRAAAQGVPISDRGIAAKAVVGRDRVYRR
jgi:hypothetical protein